MVTQIKESHIKAITSIHIQSLKGDFLPSLGNYFLETMYRGLIGRSGVYGFVDLEKLEVIGFIIGTKDMDKFFKTAIKANFLKLSLLLLLRILRSPKILKKILETFLYSKKDQGVKAELVVIAILKKWQGKGIGRKLIKSLEDKFITEKINKYKLAVYSDKKAVRFYEKLSFNKVSNFNLYGKSWYIYEKKIN